MTIQPSYDFTNRSSVTTPASPPGRALFGRRVEVTVNGVTVKYAGDDSLRITFSVEKTECSNKPNKTNIAIHNLAPSTRHLIDTGLTLTQAGPPRPAGLGQCTISAGYAGNAAGVGAVGPIFVGHVANIGHTRDGAEWVTHIVAQDGLSAQDARIKTKIPKHQTRGNVLAAMAQGLQKIVKDLDITQVLERVKQGDLAGAAETFLHGFETAGYGLDEMARVCKGTGINVSVQDGKLIMLSQNETTGWVIQLDAGRGLIGTVDPIIDEKLPGVRLVKARSLLRHDLGIGTGVKIFTTTQPYGALFRVRKVHHRGDTHGGPQSWVSEFEGVAK